MVISEDPKVKITSSRREISKRSEKEAKIMTPSNEARPLSDREKYYNAAGLDETVTESFKKSFLVFDSEPFDQTNYKNFQSRRSPMAKRLKMPLSRDGNVNNNKEKDKYFFGSGYQLKMKEFRILGDGTSFLDGG